MLKVLFGKKLENSNTCPSMYFDNVYEYDWFDDPVVIQMVKDIDKSELNGLCVLSPFLGSIPVEKLSGGIKSLILMYKLDDFVTDLIYLGNNCEDWILKIEEQKDLKVCMTGFDMQFDGKDVKALCLNDNSIINNDIEWCKKCVSLGEFIMRGSYYLKIRNNKVSYDIVLKRCITIIKGNSGTGKTNLIGMIQSFIKKGMNSGVSVNTNIRSIRVLDDAIDWRDELNKYRNSVFFVDEEVEYILQKNFADLLHETGSYLVYITRSGLTGCLQYSILDVYEFRSKKDGNIYINKLYNLYNDERVNFKPDLLLTEDSTSGKDMLEHSLNVEVQSSFGKDNMINKLDEVSDNYVNIYIFVDGAVFGNQIQFLLSKIKNLSSCNILIFAPESFEYLILNTSKFKKFCEDELINTTDYVDSSRFKTWENYFEYLLSELCKRYNNVKYEKVHWDKLNPFFRNESLLREINNQFVDLDNSVKKF